MQSVAQHTLGRRRWLLGMLGAVVLAAYLAHVARYHAYVNDDAYITFRYSLFLAQGHGPYYNFGEHVEGYTNFLLMLIVAAVIGMGGPDAAPVTAKVAGVLGGLLACWAAWGLAARWLRRLDLVARWADALGWLAAALVAVQAAFCVNSVSGLETALFAGWLTLGVWLMQCGHDAAAWRGAGVALGLAAWTRPEGLMVAAVVLGALLVTGAARQPAQRRRFVIDLLVITVMVLGHLAFRRIAYDGEWLPNTYYAKSDELALHLDAGPHLWGFARECLGGVVCGAAALPLVFGNAALRRAVLPALLVCVAGAAALFKTGTDWMIGYRLLVPYLPLWATLSVAGVAALATRLRTAPRIAALVGCGVLLVSVGWPQIGASRRYQADVEAGVRGYETGHRALTDWLQTHTQSGDTVALMDIGLVGYACPTLRILDITGLTDRTIAKSPGGMLRKHYDPAYILDQRPAFIVLTATERTRPNGTRELVPLTPQDARLAWAPQFLEHYWLDRPLPSAAERLDEIAARLGATRVFEHFNPKRPYYLVAYQKRAG